MSIQGKLYKFKEMKCTYGIYLESTIGIEYRTCQYEKDTVTHLFFYFYMQDALVEQLGSIFNPWRIAATLRHRTGDEDAELVGTQEVEFVGGVATFTDLAIDTMGSGYTLDFAVIYPDTSTLAVSSSMEISITSREYYAKVHSQPSVAYTNEEFLVIVELKDLLTEGFPQGIAAKVGIWVVPDEILVKI